MKIGIVSLGLIGGSILKSLSDKGHELYALTTNKETLDIAKKYTPFVSSDMTILKECEIVFVASPISHTIEILDKLENYISNNCIVLDCASVKEFVMKKHTYKFIGSHPMAGTENSGFSASFETLFEGAVWVLTPFDDTLETDINKVKQIITLMGAKVLITDAKSHDYAVALISHFPLLVAKSLFYYIKDNKLAQMLASSGFRDMTRIAASNTQMSIDMFNFNSKNIDLAYQKLFETMDFIKNSNDYQLLTEIKEQRQKMYSSDGKNLTFK